MQDLPGQNLFKYIDDDGEQHAVGSSDVNAYLREIMGQDFSAKNFRTWHASVKALTCLHQAEGTIPMKELLECVSDHLGNTPAVARKSYIHPVLFGLLDGQEGWRKELRLPRATRWLTREERALIELLQECPKAEDLLAA
jgi:DNA topoisomerase-1